MSQLILMALFVFAGPDNVVEVNNGPMPEGKKMSITLYEDLRITPDAGGEEFIWSGADVSVEVDNRGHMYVSDNQDNRLVELDKNGKFVRQIGKQGEGPGEFRSLINMQFLADGSAIAFENYLMISTFSYFDKNMTFQNRRNLTDQVRAFRKVRFAPDGKSFYSNATKLDQANRTETNIDAIFNAETLEPIQVIQEVVMTKGDPSQLMSPDYWADFLTTRYKIVSKGKLGYCAFDNDGNYYTATADEYKITKYNPQGKKIMVINREYTPIRQSPAEIKAYTEPLRERLLSSLPDQFHHIFSERFMEKVIEMSEFSGKKYPVFGLVTMGDKLAVIHDYSYQTKDSVADVFDKSGKFIGSFNLANDGMRKLTFKNGMAYTIETVDDAKHLVRYNVKLEAK